MPCFHWLILKDRCQQRTAEVRPYGFLLLWQRHGAIKEAAWLFQSHIGVVVGADMM